MHHDVVVVGGRSAHLGHHLFGCGHDVTEVAGVAAEALGVARVVGGRPAPEVGRIRYEAAGALIDGDCVLRRPEDEGGCACARGVFEGVAGAALRRVGADAERVVGHAAADQSDGSLHGLGTRLAGELPVCGQGGRRCADGFGHDRAGGFDGVGMALAADPHGAQFTCRDACAGQRVARRLHAHGRGVFVQAGDGLLFDGARVVVSGPDAADLFAGQPVARDVCAVAGDAHGTDWLFVHCVFPLLRLCCYVLGAAM